MKAIHGLDAEQELSNILSTEILAEINREVVRTIYTNAVKGAQNNTANAGIFDLDVDSNGRWSVEKFKDFCSRSKEMQTLSVIRQEEEGQHPHRFC